MHFRFPRHSGHGRTHRWLDPVANDPVAVIGPEPRLLA